MAKQKIYALGIDLGGTKTLAAVVDITTGEVVASARKRTRAEKGQEFVSQRILTLSAQAIEDAKLPADAGIVAVGVGAAGQIDRKAGVILDAPNLGVKDMQLGDLLNKQFGKPVAVGNDVEVAALGEFLEVIAATDHLSQTHPPGRLRVRLLVQWLGPLADPRVDAIVEPWRALAAEPITYTAFWAQFLVDTLLARAADLEATANKWPGVDYDTNTRSPVIVEISEALRGGFPPEPTILDANGRHAVPSVSTSREAGVSQKP